MVFNNISLSKDKLNIIVAFTDKNRYISYQNELPWKMNLKGDMKFINRLIRLMPNSVLIVGRKTYESIPKYKDVDVIVVTSKGVEDCNTKCFKKFSEAVSYAREKNLFIIIFGGVGIYEEAVKDKFRIYCTIVKESDLLGDRKFPELDIPLTNITKNVNDFLLENKIPKTWNLKEDNLFEENGFKYSFYCGESQ